MLDDVALVLTLVGLPLWLYGLYGVVKLSREQRAAAAAQSYDWPKADLST